ncbi:MAG: hypothetical protein ACE5LC_04395 [Candidatus Aminicenantales bacterium]
MKAFLLRSFLKRDINQQERSVGMIKPRPVIVSFSPKAKGNTLKAG